jgi:hypothetical protein
MWVIRDRGAIDDFERLNGLVAIYLDSGYDGRVTALVSDIARAFDTHVGPAWHLLIPYGEGYVPDGTVEPDQYNLALATQIARDRGIPTLQLPALVFEFVPNTEYYTVSLAGMSDDRIRNIIKTIGEISVDEFRDGKRELNEYRAAAHRRIVTYLHKERLFSVAGKVGMGLAALIASIAAVKTIGG